MPGETLIVEENAEAVIHIEKRAALMVKNAAKTVFEDIRDTVSITMDYGTVMMATRPDPRPFLLTLPTVTIRPAASTLYVECRAIDQVYVCICEGVVTLTTPDTVQIFRNADHRKPHTSVLVGPSRTGTILASPTPAMNHTVADVESLEQVLSKRTR